jgi:hypothetical protein
MTEEAINEYVKTIVAAMELMDQMEKIESLLKEISMIASDQYRIGLSSGRIEAFQEAISEFDKIKSMSHESIAKG